jgi:hypothetical protein
MTNMNDFLSCLTEEQKNKLLEALLSSKKTEEKEYQPKKIVETTPSPRQSVRVDENFFVQRTEEPSGRRKEPVKGRKNQWRDEGEFSDIETPKVDRVARNRAPHKKVDVDCSVCGKSFKIDPKYVYGEYHRCNRCVSR